MKRKQFTIIGLLVALVALTAVYFFAFNTLDEEIAQTQPTPASAYRMTEREPSEITHIVITNEHGIIALSRNVMGIWGIDAGQYVHLDQNLLRIFLTDFVNPTIETLFEAESVNQLVEFGLHPPLRSALAMYDDGTEDIIYIGHTTPDGRFFYAQMTGRDHVYLIGASAGNRYLWTFDDIIIRDMALFNPEHIVNVALTRPNEEDIWIMPNFARAIAEEIPPQLAFAGNSGLVMYAPLGGRGIWMSNFVDNIVTPAANIRLSRLANLSIENPEQYGLDVPILDLYFEYVDTGSQLTGDSLPTSHWRLRVGNVDASGEYFYVFYDGIPHIFLAHRDAITPLLEVDFFRFIDRFVHLMNIGTVESIHIQNLDSEFDIALNHGDIDAATLDIQPSINGQVVDSDGFLSFYQVLIGMTYEHMMEPIYIESQPELAITFNPGQPDAVINYFYHFDNSFYAVRNSEEPHARFLISRQAINHFYRYLDMLLNGSF